MPVAVAKAEDRTLKAEPELEAEAEARAAARHFSKWLATRESTHGSGAIH